jgi:hypothetical protein
MPSSDIDALVRDADPARTPTPEDELDALVAQARAITAHAPTRKAERRPRRALIAVPAAAAALLVALAFALHHGGASLAAKAYAATAPGDEIVHEISVRTSPNGGDATQIVEEQWSRPADGTARSVQTTDGREIAESTVDARGALHIVTSDGYASTIKPDSAATRHWIEDARSVTQWFREEYATRSLHDDGMTTFAGRRVHAYSTDVNASEAEQRFIGATTPPAHETFYLDPETALPVGVRALVSGTHGGKPGVFDTVIERYEKLPATPANLAKLR